jgi:hypothetical protein
MGLLRTGFNLTFLWVSRVHGRQGSEQMYDYVTTVRAETGQGDEMDMLFVPVSRTSGMGSECRVIRYRDNFQWHLHEGVRWGS